MKVTSTLAEHRATSAKDKKEEKVCESDSPSQPEKHGRGEIELPCQEKKKKRGKKVPSTVRYAEALQPREKKEKI